MKRFENACYWTFIIVCLCTAVSIYSYAYGRDHAQVRRNPPAPQRLPEVTAPARSERLEYCGPHGERFKCMSLGHAVRILSGGIAHNAQQTTVNIVAAEFRVDLRVVRADPTLYQSDPMNIVSSVILSDGNNLWQLMNPVPTDIEQVQRGCILHGVIRFDAEGIYFLEKVIPGDRVHSGTQWRFIGLDFQNVKTA